MENQVEKSSWILSEEHQQFLNSQIESILLFGSGAALNQGGFGILDEKGEVMNVPLDTLQNTRMTHCFSIASLINPAYGSLADHGVKALLHLIQDQYNGGWFYTIGGEHSSARKQAYIHAFVALAAASASIAKRDGAAELLEAAISVIEKYFWDEEESAMQESYAYDWTDAEGYRGANSNMHAVEAFLALAAATNDDKWLIRALSICERLIHKHAAVNYYGVVEHFDKHWNPVKEYNIEDKEHKFRPYGITPGHGFEWSRLLLSLEAELIKRNHAVPDWLLTDAVHLFDAAWNKGWNVDGNPGIVYTLDFDGLPVIGARMHWVAAEAAAAATVLFKRTFNEEYETSIEKIWSYIGRYMVDYERGSWHHNLDEENVPTDKIWRGKPDIYHILQCLLLPNLPIGGSIAQSVKENAALFSF